ncbi:MAG: hypothetical protein ACYDEV_09395 [Acidiferrobacter sp.]
MDRCCEALKGRIVELEDTLKSLAQVLLRRGISGLNAQDIMRVDEAIHEARERYEAASRS